MTAPVAAPPRHPLAILASSTSVAVAVIASTAALATIVGPGTWTSTAARTVAVLALVTGLVRVALERAHAARHEELVPPRALLPTLAGAVAGLWALLGLYGGPTDRFSLLIGLSNVDRLWTRLLTARELTVSEVAPIDPSLPIELLVVGGAVVVFLLTDLVVGGLRLAPFAMLPLLALWVPGLVIDGDIPPVPFVLTVAALVVLLALDNPHRTVRRLPGTRVRRRRHAVGGLRAAGVVAGALVVSLVGLAVATASTSLPEVVSSSWARLFSSTGQTVRLSEDLDLRRNLDERPDEVVLRYTTSADTDAGPWRMFTLTGFDGTNWRRGDDRPGEPVESADQLLWPQPVDTADPVVLDVTLESLRDTKLPIPTEPRTIDSAQSWSYDEVRDEVLGDEVTRADSAYQVRTFTRDLTPAVLQDARGDDPDDPNYLEVPETAHSADVREVAVEIAGDAPTRYDQALALQEFFRDASRFSYSTEVPRGATGDPVWDFLQNRTGYCVQYATAMTVMARDLGIPARLGVGFLPGRSLGSSTYEVTGQDSHAWPELYFPGQGWVRFEPTPALQTGPAPSWAVPRADPSGSSSDAAQDVPEEVPSTTPADPQSQGGQADDAESTTADRDNGTSAVLVGGTVLLVLVLGGAIAWLVSRRRRATHEVLDPEGAWSELIARLAERGVAVPGSTTPREMPAVVVAAIRDMTRTDGPDADTVDALREIASAVESQRYAKQPQRVDQARLRELLGTAQRGTLTALSDRPARDDAPTAPRAG